MAKRKTKRKSRAKRKIRKARPRKTTKRRKGTRKRKKPGKQRISPSRRRVAKKRKTTKRKKRRSTRRTSNPRYVTVTRSMGGPDHSQFKGYMLVADGVPIRTAFMGLDITFDSKKQAIEWWDKNKARLEPQIRKSIEKSRSRGRSRNPFAGTKRESDRLLKLRDKMEKAAVRKGRSIVTSHDLTKRERAEFKKLLSKVIVTRPSGSRSSGRGLPLTGKELERRLGEVQRRQNPGRAISYSPSLRIGNLRSLPKGTGSKYLVVIPGMGGEWVAKRWARKKPKLSGIERVIAMPKRSKNPGRKTVLPTPKRGASHLEGGTWMDREEFAYNIGLSRSPRRGVARSGGRLVAVRLGIPDTFFSIPAIGPGQKKGYVSIDNGILMFQAQK